jgi:threonyl-tRNA synthetase
MNNTKNLPVLRHSMAHLLAHAISELYPGSLLTIGPSTEEGFFYDFRPTINFKEEDLALIEARMHLLANKNLSITHEEISKDLARQLYKDNPFKLEIIDQLPGETVGLSRQGDFYDLCRGGHVDSTGALKYFKLLGISGSYWRGDKKNQPLQRISGTAFFSEDDLRAYEKQREEALLYDHRRIGKQLDLFSFHEEGVGFPFFHAKGKKILNLLVSYMRQLQEAFGYHEISTPTMLSDDLWRQSGHYAHYKDNMYFSCIDDRNYAIKPMNCPGAILIYQNRPHSYRELPLRLAEFGHVHRHELSGVLHGLMRVRAFTQDDAHIFCTPQQLEAEIVSILSIIDTVLSKFEFTNVRYALSTKPENGFGDTILWERATAALENALKSQEKNYTIQPGEGAFYGPKIEVVIEDSMKRTWQCGTVQVDFFQPENFDLTYVSSAGTKERPVIIHQAIFGSLERFFAIILEHYKGNLPLWLAPVQARILTVTDAQKAYAQIVYEQLKSSGLRLEVDLTSDPLAAQIKSAQQEKIPLMIIIGNKEVESNSLTLRHQNGKQEFGVTIDQLCNRLQSRQ